MKPFLLLLISALTFQLSAQAVTISTEPAKVEYYRMPDRPLPADYTTYSADLDIQFSELSKSGFSESYLVDTYLKLDGYKRVNKNADVEIIASIGDFFIWSEMRNTNRTKSKDKQGNTITKYTYNIELKYSLPTAVRIIDKSSNTLLDKYMSTNSETNTWTSPSYNTLDDLESYWRIQKTSRLTELHKDRIKQDMQEISYLVNNSFGFSLVNDKIRFATIGKKKHPEYDIFQKNVEILQNAFELMDADKPLDQVITKAQPALDFYTERAERYKTNNKDQKKLKVACLYNLALAYCWLEDFDQAESIAKSIQRFDTKNKDVRRLIDEIEYTRASLYNAGRTSRHQVVVGDRT
jgi:hypothetical protein